MVDTPSTAGAIGDHQRRPIAQRRAHRRKLGQGICAVGAKVLAAADDQVHGAQGSRHLGTDGRDRSRGDGHALVGAADPALQHRAADRAASCRQGFDRDLDGDGREQDGARAAGIRRHRQRSAAPLQDQLAAGLRLRVTEGDAGFAAGGIHRGGEPAQLCQAGLRLGLGASGGHDPDDHAVRRQGACDVQDGAARRRRAIGEAVDREAAHHQQIQAARRRSGGHRSIIGA
jgi:hypothetical protein